MRSRYEHVVEQGLMDGRPYRLLNSGRVEYETVAGLKFFENKEMFQNYFLEGGSPRGQSRSNISLGLVLIVLGLAITFGTLAAGGSHFVVAYGMVGAGVVLLIRNLS